MLVDKSYPGLDEPLTGIVDAEQRHRCQRRRSEQHLALYRLAARSAWGPSIARARTHAKEIER
jgi:hypothetical protein